MRLTKYGIFIKILEAGSFSEAAEKLNYTQSAISQLVQSMEAELGVPLLHRSKKGLSLTTEGERMLPLFYEIYNAETRLSDMLCSSTNNLTGTIRIGAYTSISCSLLPKVIQSFRNKYPLVDYQVIHGNYKEIENLVINGRVDLGFVRYPLAHKLDMFRFQPESLVVIMPAFHRLAYREQLSIEDLDKEEFVLLDDGYSNEIISFFEKNNIMPKINQKVKGNLALFGFVAGGCGVSVVPSPLIHLLPQNIIWKMMIPSPHRSIAIACKDLTKLSLANKLFFNEIVAIGTDIIGKYDG